MDIKDDDMFINIYLYIYIKHLWYVDDNMQLSTYAWHTVNINHHDLATLRMSSHNQN